MKRLPFAAFAAFVQSSSSFACIRNEDSFDPAPVILFMFVLLFISVLVFLAWAVWKVFFRRYAIFSVLLVSASILSLVLGIFGTLGLPEFESIFSAFGSDLPLQTKVLLAGRHLLWLPTLLVIVLWHTSRNAATRARHFAAALFAEICLLALALWAIYSPIFKLASVCV